MVEQRSPRGAVPRAVSLSQVPTAVPGLRFAVRFPDGTGSAGAGRGDVGRGAGAEHEAGASHPLAGTGKLFLALTVARLAAREPGLAPTPLTIRDEHRAAARTGTLRRMSGDLDLTVDDAMALVVGTGDGACVAALLEHLARRGIDVLAEARDLTAALGLDATALTALEETVGGATAPDAGARGSVGDAGGTEGTGVTEGAAASWGEGLTGSTTPGDLCTLLCRLVAAASPGVVAPADRHGADGTEGDGTGGVATADTADPLGAVVADRVLGWMGTAFEPAGLAGVLPGVGPRTLPHRTVTGLELCTPPGAGGWASVLILPADVESGRPTACVAAYQPPVHRGEEGRRTAVRPLEASAALGTLGLAVNGARG